MHVLIDIRGDINISYRDVIPKIVRISKFWRNLEVERQKFEAQGFLMSQFKRILLFRRVTT